VGEGGLGDSRLMSLRFRPYEGFWGQDLAGRIIGEEPDLGILDGLIAGSNGGGSDRDVARRPRRRLN